MVKAAAIEPTDLTPIKNISTDDQKAGVKEKLRKFVEEETKMVKGRFRCFETPGMTTRIQMKKYKDVPMFDKIMTDNEVYEVPLYVARHLNGIDATATAIDGKINSCSVVQHGFSMSNPNDLRPAYSDGHGIPVPLIVPAKYIRRYGFESLEFSA